MNEQIKKLAEQSGLITNQDIEENNYEYMNNLERFAELVRDGECERMKSEFKSQYYLNEKDVKKVVDSWKNQVANLKTTIQLLKTLEQTGKTTVKKKFTELSDDEVSSICFDWYEFMRKNKTENLRHLAMLIAIKIKEKNT